MEDVINGSAGPVYGSSCPDSDDDFLSFGAGGGIALASAAAFAADAAAAAALSASFSIADAAEDI